VKIKKYTMYDVSKPDSVSVFREGKGFFSVRPVKQSWSSSGVLQEDPWKLDYGAFSRTFVSS
jgi:hypothetical protein